MADDGSVRVGIRVRPFIGIERGQDYSSILAYGQTGSGKTHTMGTASSAGLKKDEFGIIPRVIHELFDLMRSKEKTHIFLLSVAFLEIYNDDIFDLLCTIPRGRADRPIPQIKEGRGDKIEVDNIVKQEVKSAEEALEALERGSMARATGSTNMNATSSRSHAIFTLQLSQKVLEKDELGVSNDEFITSKFHFVDLAGSERLKRTGAVGERMREGININQGLLALGNVISALGDPTRKGGHVPFRDSKITRLLQDSLGGNSKTLMIANVSPADVNKEETLNTLQYANRAKNIKNKPVINRDPMSQKLDLLRGRIKQLEAELAVYQSGNIPTAEQKAAFAALAENIAAGGIGIGSSNSVYSSSGHHHHPSSAFSSGDFSSLPASQLGADEIGVNAKEWVFMKDQLATYEIELKKLQNRNASLRQDLNGQGEEKLRAVMWKDAYRLKIEALAEKFPQVKEYLIQEREQLVKEKKIVDPNATPAATSAASPEAGESPSGDAADGTAPVSSPTPAQILSEYGSAAETEEEKSDEYWFSIPTTGGVEATFNKDLLVLHEKNHLLSKLVRKYRKQKEELVMGSSLLMRFKKKMQFLRSKNEELKVQIEEGDVGAAGGDDLNTSRDRDDEDLDEDLDDSVGGAGDEISADASAKPRRKNSSSIKESPTAAAAASADANAAAAAGGEAAAAAVPTSAITTSALEGTNLNASDLSDLEEDEAAVEEEDFESLTTLAALKEQEHAYKMKLLQDEDMGASKEISVKEAFLQQLTQEKQRSIHQRQMYERAISDLQRDKDETDARVTELEKAISIKPASEAQNNELKTLKEKLKQVNAELRTYRDKIKDFDKLKKQHSQDELRIKQLTVEIEKAKKQRVDVAKKMDENQSKYREWVEMKEQKLKFYEKSQRKNELQLRTLKNDYHQQELQLKRMKEVNSLLSKKVREQDSATRLAKEKAERAKLAGGSGIPSAAARKAANPPPRANMPYLGNYNAHASDTKLKNVRAAEKSRRKTPTSSSSSTKKSESAGASILNSPQARSALRDDFLSFLATENAREHLEREVLRFQAHKSRMEQNLDNATERLMSTDGDLSNEQMKRLEEDVTTWEQALQVTQADLLGAQQAVRDYDRVAGIDKDGAASSSLEERFAAKFKTVLAAESAVRVVTVIARALFDMQQQHTAGGQPNVLLAGAFPASSTGQFGPTFHPEHHGHTQSEQFAPNFNPMEAINSPTHARRASTTATTSSLSSSPIFKAHSRASLTNVSSPSKTRKSAAILSPVQPAAHPASSPSSTTSTVQQYVGLTGYHPWIQLSSLQDHLCQFDGEALTQTAIIDESGDETLVYLTVNNEHNELLHAQQHFHTVPAPENSPTSLFTPDGDEPFTIAAPLKDGHAGGYGSNRNNGPLHNNFLSPVGSDDSLTPTGAHLSHDRNSGGPLSSSSASSRGKPVFDRLTDPNNFTGVSKTVAQDQKRSNATGGGRSGSVMGSGAVVPPLSKKPTLTSGVLSSSQPSGTQSARVSSYDRSPSPSLLEDTTPASARDTKVPIHERLYDPKSYTGAQRAKFAEGVPKRQNQSATTAATTTTKDPMKEREEGFVLGNTHRNAAALAAATQQAMQAAQQPSPSTQTHVLHTPTTKSDSDATSDAAAAVFENKENVTQSSAQDASSDSTDAAGLPPTKPHHARTRSSSRNAAMKAAAAAATTNSESGEHHLDAAEAQDTLNAVGDILLK